MKLPRCEYVKSAELANGTSLGEWYFAPLLSFLPLATESNSSWLWFQSEEFTLTQPGSASPVGKRLRNKCQTPSLVLRRWTPVRNVSLFKSLACLKTRSTRSAPEASSLSKSSRKVHSWQFYFPDLFSTSLPDDKVFSRRSSYLLQLQKGLESGCSWSRTRPGTVVTTGRDRFQRKAISCLRTSRRHLNSI